MPVERKHWVPYGDAPVLGMVRRVLVGPPLPTHRITHERLGPFGGLAVFASDALSSVAYGTEEILIMLMVAGTLGLGYTVPVGIAIAVLIAIVATSYRQTVIEYPSGGGAYVVARDNLGRGAAHLAGAALLTDYVLTVAVSVAAGVAAITSAWQGLYEQRVLLAVIWVGFVMLVNLRGVRESAAVFALPVYTFIVSMLALVAVGLWHVVRAGTAAAPPPIPPVVQPLSLFLILRAFSSGGATLTGIEAVANGVQAFRAPAGPNAARVLTMLAALLGVMFMGTTLLAHELGVAALPQDQPGYQTVVSQIARSVFGSGVMYYVLQVATAVILVLAANTSFAGFPRLAAFMAQDSYLPRQFTHIGNRLVYSNGIIVLALLASGLIAAFGGEVTRLIPLYAVGVFTAFTLSQSGMVLHWMRKGGPAWRRKAAVNGFGAGVTGVVLIVIAVTKFALGAWIVCIVIPVLVLGFRGIRSHYDFVASRLSLQQAGEVQPLRNVFVLLAGGMHRGTLEALEYARSLGGECRALHVEIGGESTPRVERLWAQWAKDIPLTVIASPYRSLAGPVLEYINRLRTEEGYDIVTIVLPEFVVNRWWETLLHNQSALWLQFILRNAPGVAVLNMRYKL